MAMEVGGVSNLRSAARVAAVAAMVWPFARGARGSDLTINLSTVATDPYFAGDINSCAIQLNNITTAGTHEFLAYYNTSRTIVIARRDLGSTNWQTYNTGFSIASNEITDDHNVIAIGVDSGGFLHMSWNMHNVSLNYAISAAPVTGDMLSSISFDTKTAANAPSLFSNAGATTNEVTYPIFMPIPGSSNMLFTYRNGGAGGGSGNGNQYFDVYNPTAGTWTNKLAINGEQTSVNAYLNSPVYTSTNNLLMSWTWRASPAWQTNSNIMFAQSPDNGNTWFKQGGTTQYTLPIIQSGTPSGAVAQVIKTIPQNSSFINQTSMTVDNEDHPIIATWWAPNWNPATNSGDPNRQYMLEYYTGTQWKTSQITHRTSDTAIDTSAFAVRDLGRPIVLVDDRDRVLVVTRSQDTAMGKFSDPTVQNNDIVIYYTSNLSSGSPTWNSVTLDTADMGSWEPTYDATLWQTQHKLALFYEPVGITGQTSSAVKVLEWDEAAFFANVPEPATASSVALLALLALRRGRRRLSPSPGTPGEGWGEGDLGMSNGSRRSRSPSP